MQAAQPRRSAWGSRRLRGAGGSSGAVPATVPAVVKALAIVEVAPFDHVDAQPIIPVSGSMRRRRIARMAALSGRTLGRRWRADRRRNDRGLASIRQPGAGLWNWRLRLIRISRTGADQQRGDQQAGAPENATRALKRFRFHDPHARPLATGGWSGLVGLIDDQLGSFAALGQL